VEVTARVVIPVLALLHTKRDDGGRGIRTRVETGGIPSPVIDSSRLTRDGAAAEGASGVVGVVFERHAGDKENSLGPHPLFIPDE
jgi:hypothetical protein